MLTINFTYQESQDILYCLREMINSTCNLKHQKAFEKASDKIKKAIHHKGVVLYHEEGKAEEVNNVEEFRLADVVERVNAG